MPSFFRSDIDVKIVFDKKRVLTPEEKKQKKRLMIPFDQSVRRAGTKGNFFFHRKKIVVEILTQTLLNQGNRHAQATLHRELIENKRLIGNRLKTPGALKTPEITLDHPELQQSLRTVLSEFELNFCREFQA